MVERGFGCPPAPPWGCRELWRCSAVFSVYRLPFPPEPGQLHRDTEVTTRLLPRCCCGSVAQLCLTLCHAVNCSVPGFPVLHCLPEFAQTYVIELVMSSNHLILCHPLLLLPSIFPSDRVLSNELALHIR